MPEIGRLLLISTFVASVVYVLFIQRRKKRPQEALRAKNFTWEATENFLEDPLLTAIETVPDLDIDCLEVRAACCPVSAVASQAAVCLNVCIASATEVIVKQEEIVEANFVEFLQMSSSVEESTLVLSTEASVIPVSRNPDTKNFDLSLAQASPGSESEVHTPDSNELSCSPDDYIPFSLSRGCFNDPANNIIEDNPEEHDGKLLPKVLIPSELWEEGVDKDVWHETFCIPAHMGGVLIGRLGKNVRELRVQWNAEFSLNVCPGRQDTLLFNLSCPLEHKEDVLRWVARRFKMRPSRTPIGNPNQLRRFLPLGQLTPVHIRSLYGLKEFFVTLQDDQYGQFVDLQRTINEDYGPLNNFRMQLCEPVTSGTVAVVPHSDGFGRALILSVYSTNPKSALYFLLDHGTFGVCQISKLRKIRAKYMRLPFQAVHVSWAHAFPLFSDVPDLHVLRTLFSSGQTKTYAVRMETCCRASVVFAEPCPGPPGLIDTLVTACHTGLCTVVPLSIYPQRQAWLNGTDTSYYPATFSTIDYMSFLHMVPEEPVMPANGSDEICVPPRKNATSYRHRAGGAFRHPTPWQKTYYNHQFPCGGAYPRAPFSSGRRQMWQNRRIGYQGQNTERRPGAGNENMQLKAIQMSSDGREKEEPKSKGDSKRRPLAAHNAYSVLQPAVERGINVFHVCRQNPQKRK